MQKQHQDFTPTKDEIFTNKPFRLGLFAASNSGKTHLISEILTNPSWGLDCFNVDKIVIICPTISFDDSYTKVIDHLEKRSTKDHEFNKDKQLFEKDLETALINIYKQIFEEQKSKKQGGLEQDKTLIILDDILLEMDLSSQHSVVAKVLCKCRHANCSIILVSQHMMALAAISRNQLSHTIFFSTTNHKEIKKIKDELSGDLNSKQFDSIYSFCTGDPYSYMLCIHSYPTKWRYFKGQGSDLHQIQI